MLHLLHQLERAAVSDYIVNNMRYWKKLLFVDKRSIYQLNYPAYAYTVNYIVLCCLLANVTIVETLSSF